MLIICLSEFCYYLGKFSCFHFLCYKYPVCHFAYLRCVSELMQTQENHLQLFDEFSLGEVSFSYCMLHMHQFIVWELYRYQFWYYCLAFEQPKLFTSKFLFSFWYLQPAIVAFLHHIYLLNHTLLHSLLLHSICSSFLQYYSIIVAFLAYIFFEMYWPISCIIGESYFKLFYTIFVSRSESSIWVFIQLK